MHLMITRTKRNGKFFEYAKIARSYRENEKIKKEIIMNLGAIKSDEDKKRYKEILDDLKKGEKFIKRKDIIFEDSKEYGITYIANKLLEKYNLDNILQKELTKNKAQFDVYSTIKALIINRLTKPSSDLSAYDWMKNDYSEKLDVKKHQVYRALDYLIQRKDNIEKKIFDSLKEKLNLNTNLVHYDLTSSYLEGKKCEIAFYGYSRDHRKDRKQIVIGLVMCDGIPIYHEVFEGNAVDKSTLKEMVKNLKQKLGIKKVTIIADGGLLTKDNLENLEDNKQKYILGNPRRNNKMAEKYLTKKIDSKENQSAKEVGKEEIKRGGKEYTRRYILCLNKNTKKERLETLDEIKEKKEKELMELQVKYEKSQIKKKGKKITKESMINQAYKILGKNKRLFDIEEKDGKLNISFIKDTYDYEKKIAGKFLIVTNTDEKADKIMKTYKELQMVENAFDEIKNFLDVRGIYHWKERRVKAHVFVCVLGFLVESIIERFSDESARKILKKLERIQIGKIKVGEENVFQLTEKSLQLSKEIFKNLGIKMPNNLYL